MIYNRTTETHDFLPDEIEIDGYVLISPPEDRQLWVLFEKSFVGDLEILGYRRAHAPIPISCYENLLITRYIPDQNENL